MAGRGTGRPARKGRTEVDATDLGFLREAIALARKGMRAGHGGPFGALVVRDGKVLARGWNRVLSAGDPTAHAEVTAIRAACRKAGSFLLEGAVLYTSCEPCPMCLGAAYWARVARIVYAATRRDAAAIGFTDAFIYAELGRPLIRRRLPIAQALRREALGPFAEWRAKADKTPY